MSYENVTGQTPQSFLLLLLTFLYIPFIDLIITVAQADSKSLETFSSMERHTVSYVLSNPRQYSVSGLGHIPLFPQGSNPSAKLRRVSMRW